MSTLQGSFSELARAMGRSWWVVLLYGIVAILFGAMALAKPMDAAIGMAWAFGIMALVEAGIGLVALFSRDVFIPKGWLAFYTIASGLFGVAAVMYPTAMAGSLVLMLALWLILAGIYRIVFAIRVRKVIEGEWLLILSGILSIILGVLFMMNPMAGMITTSLWIGAFALVYGGFQVYAAFKLRKLA